MTDRIYAWFNLSYDTPDRGRVTLRGISGAAVEEITKTQTDLGATNFEVVEVPAIRWPPRAY
jgi:hypothetical protein